MTTPLAAHPVAVPADVNVHPASPHVVRLNGRTLALARAGWLAFALVAALLFLVSLPYHAARLARFTDPSLQDPEAVRAGVERLGISPWVFAGLMLVPSVAFAAVYFGVALVIFRHRSADVSALLFALTFVAFGATFTLTLDALVAVHPVLRAPGEGLRVVGWASFFLLFYLFPDGRFVPSWSRWLAAFWVGGVLASNLAPDAPVSPSSWPAPLSAAVLFGSWIAMILAQVYRYRRVSDRLQRQQTKWAALGFGVAIASLFVGEAVAAALPAVHRPGVPAALFPLGWAIFYVAAFSVLPIAVAFGIFRHRLWDIDLVLNRALVYAVLVVCLGGVYAAFVTGFGALFQARGSLAVSLPATVLVAVLCQPLRDRLQRGVNRLLYGERDDPYAVLSRLGRRLEGALEPDAVLPSLVETVREALRVPYVAIVLHRDGEQVTEASSGDPAGEPVRLPLVFQHEMIGELLVAPRAPGEAFDALDQRLLEDLARQAGGAVHAVRLHADLQRSRERLVGLREEERRRLRRDLHDGLGPMLGSLTLKLDAVRQLMRRDPDAADRVLSGTKDQTQRAMADIRRLVYALRPPALDELGLVGALREAAAQFVAEDGGGPRVTVEAPDALPPLPAAVEVAAYRIAQEALTNVVRHAEAASCRLRLGLDPMKKELWLEVVDDGRGLAPGRHHGVGLRSMRERADELGGHLIVDASPGSGTAVRVRLPIVPTAASDDAFACGSARATDG